MFGIQGFALKGIEKRETMLNQTVVTIQVRPADLSGIAQLPDVLWIEPVIKNINHDEMQALIVATDTNVDCSYTNVDGVVIGYRHGPVPGDSYLDFLNAHSFSFNPAHYPVLDIADTGLDKVNPYPYNSGCGWSGTGFYVPFHPSFFTAGAFLNDYSSLTDAIANTMCCVSVSVFESRVMYNTAGTDTDGHGTAVASVASGYDDFTNTLPYEIVHCHRDAKISLSTTNYQCVTSNSVTFVLTTNAPATDCVCTNNVTLHLVALGCLTNVTTIGDYCQRYTDFGGQDLFPNPDPFPAGVYRRDPTVTVLSWSPLTSATNNFQLGLGVSPFGRIGASLGGAQTGYAGPAGEISAAYLQDARISNNSWGQGYNGANGGVYDSRAEAYDALVRNASTNTSGATALNQEMSIVFSAGNGNGIGGAGGYGETLITSPGTAKNVITVGASKNLHLGFRASDIDNSFDIADFSSFGPTLDGRFKPEIVAPGSGISAALSQGTYTQWGCFGCDPNDTNNFQNCADFETLWPTIVSLYEDPSGGVATYYGTSFSAPAVSGGIQLLWWWFQNQLNMLQPSPAMAKAYLLNSARYLPIHDPLYTSAMDTLPSIAQGMGIMDLDRMFDLVRDAELDGCPGRSDSVPGVGQRFGFGSYNGKRRGNERLQWQPVYRPGFSNGLSRSKPVVS